VFDWIAKAYNWAVGKVDTTTAGWVHDILSTLWGFLHSLFGVVITAWDDFYTRVKNFITGIGHFIVAVDDAFTYLWHVWWKKVWAYITVHIIKPLLSAVHWVEHEGLTIWHYITHPADLVDLIFDPLVTKIEAEAWSLGDKLGKFFLSLMVKNLKRFLTLMEDVLDALV
jgi:hypothetical protein